MDEEQIERTKQAFKNYQDDCVNRLSYQQMALSRATLKQKTVLMKAGFGEYLTSLLNCIEANQNVLNEILDASSMQFSNNSSEDDSAVDDEDVGHEAAADMTAKRNRTLRCEHQRVNCALLSIAREWSPDGAEERDAIYGPILEELNQRLQEHQQRLEEETAEALEQQGRGDLTVLVPGSGLARLPFEIATRFSNLSTSSGSSSGGVQVLANESNVSALFAANFILNRCERVDNFRIYPYVSDLTDRLTSQSVTNPVAFPDIDVIGMTSKDFKFQMIPGDFEELCNNGVIKEESMDFVVTCFFLDSARSVVTYVEKMWQVLRFGGIWINLGDMGCRHEKFEEEPTVTIPWTVLKQLIAEDFKFKILKEEIVEINGCFFQGSSMRENVFKCPFFVCQK